MILNNIRLLVHDFDKCFRFYADQVGLPVTWGKPGGAYASFDLGPGTGKMGLSIFKSDLMAAALGNADLPLPVRCREKTVIVIQVEDVDKAYGKLRAKGVDFVNRPHDMAGWGSRVAHFRDPEDNLIEIYAELSKDQWSADLIEESKDYDL